MLRNISSVISPDLLWLLASMGHGDDLVLCDRNFPALRHKWIESEKAGYDIGFERALIDWVVKYRSTRREKRYRS